MIFQAKDVENVSNDNKKRFKIFDTQREGRGVEKGEDTSPTLGFFFKQLGRKFWKLVSVNLIMILQIVPLVIGIAIKVMTQPASEGIAIAGANIFFTMTALLDFLIPQSQVEKVKPTLLLQNV